MIPLTDEGIFSVRPVSLWKPYDRAVEVTMSESGNPGFAASVAAFVSPADDRG